MNVHVPGTSVRVWAAAVLLLSFTAPLWSQRLQSAGLPGGRPELPGELEVRALAESYPDRIRAAEIRGGEWALRMDDRWYYWANGRLLSEEEHAQWERYIAVRFYTYELGPLQRREITPEMEAGLRDRSVSRNNDTRLRHNGFQDTLYGISSREEAEEVVVTVNLLGFRVRVHPLLRAPLVRVEAGIRESMQTDRDVRDFVQGLGQVAGYNWRNITGTLRRSYHSYGVALDLIPTTYGRRYAYWQWALDAGIGEWWNLPTEDRWPVPQPVIDAFETNGFIWGGKWLSFDNIHFEYRPEAVLMARWRSP